MRFTCEKSMLVQALNIASRAVASKSSLTVIEGILCRAEKELSFTGYNMETGITYTVEADISDPGKCILPARLFSDIIRRLPEGPVTVVVDESYKVSIRAGYASFTISAESADDYPELPDVGAGRRVSIPQQRLKELISGTIFAVSENQGRPIHTGVKFEVEEELISAIAGDGNELEIGFNVRYLADALRVIPSEEVTLELTNGLSPIVLTPVDDKMDFAYMILPVRIKNG